MGIADSTPISEEKQQKWCKLMLEKCEEEQIYHEEAYTKCVHNDFRFKIQYCDENYSKPGAIHCDFRRERRVNVNSYCEQIKEMCKDGNLPFDKE